MLKIFRKNTKKIVWIVVLSFISFGASTTILSQNKKGKYIGEMFGKKITRTDFDQAYRTIYFSPRIQSLMQKGENITEDILTDHTFQHLVFLYCAKKHSTKVSNDEVRTEILRRFSSPSDGFNERFYHRWVQNVTGLSTRLYEEGIRSELLVQKYVDTLEKDITVTGEEIREYFYKEHRKLKIAYCFLEKNNFKDQPDPTQKELVAYYQAHLDNFMTKKKYSFYYKMFSPNDYKDEIQVSEDEITSYYEENKNIFSQASDKVALPLEDVRDEIINDLSLNKARELASYDAISFNNNTLSDFEQSRPSMKAGQLLTIDEISEKIGSTRNLKKTFDKMPINSVRLIRTSNGSCVISLRGYKNPENIDFSHSKENVTNLLMDENVNTAIYKKGFEIYNEIQNNSLSIPDAMNTYSIEGGQTDFFGSKDDAILDSLSTYEVFQKAWNKTPQHVLHPFSLSNGKVVIAKILEVNDPPNESFEKEQDSISARLLEFKQFFELQKKISEILREANLRKYDSELKL